MVDKDPTICQFPYCRVTPGESGMLLKGAEHCEWHASAVLIYMDREGLSLTQALAARSTIHKELSTNGRIAQDHDDA